MRSIARVRVAPVFFKAQGIGIENYNKFLGSLLFGYFFLGEQEKVTCCRSTTDKLH